MKHYKIALNAQTAQFAINVKQKITSLNRVPTALAVTAFVLQAHELIHPMANALNAPIV